MRREQARRLRHASRRGREAAVAILVSRHAEQSLQQTAWAGRLFVTDTSMVPPRLLSGVVGRRGCLRLHRRSISTACSPHCTNDDLVLIKRIVEMAGQLPEKPVLQPPGF